MERGKGKASDCWENWGVGPTCEDAGKVTSSFGLARLRLFRIASSFMLLPVVPDKVDLHIAKPAPIHVSLSPFSSLLHTPFISRLGHTLFYVAIINPRQLLFMYSESDVSAVHHTVFRPSGPRVLFRKCVKTWAVDAPSNMFNQVFNEPVRVPNLKAAVSVI